MATATLDVETPAGFPVELVFTPEDDSRHMAGFVERVEELTQYLAGRGWLPAEVSTVTPPGTPPSAAELSRGSMFCGYPCSSTVDDRGLPSWIIAEGRGDAAREAG